MVAIYDDDATTYWESNLQKIECVAWCRAQRFLAPMFFKCSSGHVECSSVWSQTNWQSRLCAINSSCRPKHSIFWSHTDWLSRLPSLSSSPRWKDSILLGSRPIGRADFEQLVLFFSRKYSILFGAKTIGKDNFFAIIGPLRVQWVFIKIDLAYLWRRNSSVRKLEICLPSELWASQTLFMCLWHGYFISGFAVFAWNFALHAEKFALVRFWILENSLRGLQNFCTHFQKWDLFCLLHPPH